MRTELVPKRSRGLCTGADGPGGTRPVCPSVHHGVRPSGGSVLAAWSPGCPSRPHAAPGPGCTDPRPRPGLSSPAPTGRMLGPPCTPRCWQGVGGRRSAAPVGLCGSLPGKPARASRLECGPLVPSKAGCENRETRTGPALARCGGRHPLPGHCVLASEGRTDPGLRLPAPCRPSRPHPARLLVAPALCLCRLLFPAAAAGSGHAASVLAGAGHSPAALSIFWALVTHGPPPGRYPPGHGAPWPAASCRAGGTQSIVHRWVLWGPGR